MAIRPTYFLHVIGLLLFGFVFPCIAQDDSSTDEPDEEKWDVSSPLSPAKEVTIETDEGTWMSIDVSPDGATVMFDLLGDIFTVPIEGGDAQPLTQGHAWDMQPRYSPDGSLITYTSDSGGGDNIWVMNSDGSDAEAITDESFRLYNSPAWTPDGQYVAARKHFTSRRSAGAGEVWLMHVEGGDGVQMVERPNDQKDLGQPAFGPEGRYLYYSLDATPGDQFEYSKDPNAGIYAIKRLDRMTGRDIGYISGPGGAISPTPSPDGKYIAFIRRVRYKTVLWLHDIDSSAEWPIFDGLDRDMQETWAIHGVYPNMAWTPDSESIVFWAEGTIQRIDVATKERSTIPFHVKATHTLEETLRFPVDVAPDTFRAKAIRWSQVSPDGKRIVFQALGHLYTQDFPDGSPKRLTRQDDHFEFWPSWSRDSKSIVYTTWNDKTLGSVRIVSTRGGRGRVVTEKPGHYVEPVFTPDGKQIVYRRVGPDSLRSRTWYRDAGVYVVSVRGGEGRLVTRKGVQPHFGLENARVFLLDASGGENRTLFSVGLDGAEERSHFTSKNAVEMRVSHDESWVAFAERFKAFVTPFVRSGKPVELGPDMSAAPVRKLSDDTGMYLHWSGDSQELRWSLGPQVYTIAIDDAQSVFSDDEEAASAADKTELRLQVSADVPSGSLAFTGARIITMNGSEVIDSGVIVVRGNRITAIGRMGEVALPDKAHHIDASGRTIIPGLIDVHHHGPHGSNGITPQQNWSNSADMAFGLTTAHNPSADTMTIFSASEMARAGIITAPRTFSTGTILYGAAGAVKAEINSLDDARLHLRRLKSIGAFSVKSYNQPRRDQRQQIVAAARELEMMVVPEGGSLYMHNMTMILDGHTGIEHTVPVERIYKDALTLWSNSGTAYTPTLVVAYGGTFGENYWYQKSNVWENERLMGFVPRRVVDPRSRRRVMVPDEEFNHIRIAEGAKALIDVGGKVQLGAHGQLPGLGIHWELWMFVQGGMTPHEALRAGTLAGAEYLGMDGDIGSLEAGKLADFLVLEANPLDDIRNSEQIQLTIANGRVFDARTMNEAGNHPREREPFHWEAAGRP
jgi:imidazolonepropionase-like amidohydrolase/Tol biopolymer transport system component